MLDPLYVIVTSHLSLSAILHLLSISIEFVLYWRTLIAQHLDISFNLCLKKEGEQSFWLYVEERSFVSNTLKKCPIKMNLTI